MKLALSLILSFVFLLWFIASVVGMVYRSVKAERFISTKMTLEATSSRSPIRVQE